MDRGLIAAEQEAEASEAGPPPENIGDRPLHVGIDVRTWEMSGLGTYVRELLGAFARLQLPLRFSVVGPERVRSQMPEGLAVSAWHPFDAPLYGGRAFFRYPDPGPVDLFHYPHYNLPRVKAPKLVVNVFDLFHLRYGSWAKRRYQAFFLTRLRMSGRSRLVAASEKTQLELEELAGIDRDRVTLIPLGAGRAPMGDIALEPPRLSSLAGTELRAPWLLATGIDQTHKNLDFLLSALSLYFQKRPDAPSLVWSGLGEHACKRRARQLSALARRRVALLPHSDARQLEALYRGALVLIFPSLDEGFGLPPLEAMSRGVPVICARREPMTSILGDAPLYFEPNESASLWRSLDRVLDLPAMREEFVKRGRYCAAAYRWEDTALRTYDLYRSQVAGVAESGT